jgi:hypothetical protein
MVPPRWNVTSELNDPCGACVVQSRRVTCTAHTPASPLGEAELFDCAAAWVPPDARPPASRESPPAIVRHRLTLALAAIALLAVVAWAWRGTTSADSSVTLAVLPFENLSGDPNREYLAEGLAEETIASLGQMDPERMRVVGRTSIMAYKGTTKSLATIGRELGTDYLVDVEIDSGP